MAIACCSVITIIKDAKKKDYEKYRFFKNVYFFFTDHANNDLFCRMNVTCRHHMP